MSSASIILPVPINVEYRKPGSRVASTKKTYNEYQFSVPSFSADQVCLVAQWCQPWGTSKQTSGSEVNLVGGDWCCKLSQAEHMVALLEVGGAFYVPVRGREHDGAVQYLVTSQNASNVLASGLSTIGPFGSSLNFHPQYMGFNFRSHGVVGGRPFSEGGLSEGQVMVGTNEVERIGEMARYLERNFIIVDDVVFSQIAEPKIVVKPGVEKVSMFMATKTEDETLIPIFNHYFRLDEYERALQLVEDRWSKDVITSQFSDLTVVDPGSLSSDLEVVEAVRLSRRYLDKLGPVLQEMDWDTAEPWYELKKLLRNPAPDVGDVDQLISLVETSANALERNVEIDADWREKTVLYARLGTERWVYRPVTPSGPRI